MLRRVVTAAMEGLTLQILSFVMEAMHIQQIILAQRLEPAMVARCLMVARYCCWVARLMLIQQMEATVARVGMLLLYGMDPRVAMADLAGPALALPYAARGL